jgi:hypothetical protein
MRALGEWNNFVEDVQAYYDVDLSCITKEYESEQREYLHQTASWSDVHPGNLLGKSAVIKEFDLRTISLEEVKGPIRSEFVMHVTRPGLIQGLAGFFDSSFKGSPANPTDQEVGLVFFWLLGCCADVSPRSGCLDVLSIGVFCFSGIGRPVRSRPRRASPWPPLWHPCCRLDQVVATNAVVASIRPAWLESGLMLCRWFLVRPRMLRVQRTGDR